MKHKIRSIPLQNQFEQQIILPKKTQVLSFNELLFIPQMNVLMQSDQQTDELYTVRLFTALNAPEDMSDFTYCCHYLRQSDQITVYCFYKKEELP